MTRLLSSSNRPALVVGALVVASTVVRFLAAQQFTVPWIAPDEMLYGLLGESLWTDGTLAIRGTASPYYSLLTPALVGVASLGGDLAAGIQRAQLLQALAMSSTAIPVYVWARRLAPGWWATGAAGLALAGPALAYSGLLMTEALFLPACTWALLALADALERPTAARQGVFLVAVTIAAAVRMQALVLLPAFAVAALLFALAGRDRARLRAVAPLAGAIAGCLAVGLVVRLAAPGLLGSDDLLGAYATLGDEGGVGASALAFVSWHLAGVALIAVVAPALATALLTWDVFGRGSDEPSLQAFVATVAAYVPLLALQVGLFAVDRLDHVSQRYLVTASPLLMIGLVAWVSAGAPRPRVATLTVGIAVVLVTATIPPSRLVPEQGMHDALSSAPLLWLTGHATTARLLVVALAVGTLAAVTLVPRRRLGLMVGACGLALVAGSIESSRLITRLSSAAERATFGGDAPDWLDRAGYQHVTLLLTGERPPTADARTVFWNRGVTEIIRVDDAAVGVPPAPSRLELEPDTGVLRTTAGRSVSRELVAAPIGVTLEGDPVATSPVGTREVPGLAVWRTTDPLRIASRTIGILPNGDFGGEATVVVPGCRPGALEMTLLGKSGQGVTAWVNGALWGSLPAPPGSVAHLRVPAPTYVDGSRACTFVIRADGFVGTTRVAYVPD